MTVSRLKAALKSICSGFLKKKAVLDTYDPESFFRERHQKYGFDLRSVGNCTLSHEENRRQYEKAGQVVLQLLKQELSGLETRSILDIGCGTGFYAGLLRDAGATNYLGIDIMGDRFGDLLKEYPSFSFRKCDVTSEDLDGRFEIIIMIDVTQHIVDDNKFSAAMHNIRSHLADDGVFVVTSWLSSKWTRRTFYEVARPMCYYTREFAGCRFSEPVPFRDKFIFSIRKSLPQVQVSETGR